jgi:hypothetical protein
MMTTPAGVALSYRRVFVCATTRSVYEFLGRCTTLPKRGNFGRLPLNLWRKDTANAYILEFPPTIENGSLTCSGLTTVGVGLANGCRAAGQGLTQVMASLPYQHMKTATTPKLKPPAPGFKQTGTSLSGPGQASKSQATRALFRGGHPAAADQRELCAQYKKATGIRRFRVT